MRKRLFATAVNRNTMHWIGPEDMDLVTEDFMTFFRVKVLLNADSFVGVDCPIMQKTFRMALAAMRGIYNTTAVDQMQLEDFLPPGGRTRLQKHIEAFEKLRASAGHVPAWAADLSQNPDHMFRAGVWMPTLARSSVIASLTKRRLFTPGELSFSQGWPRQGISDPKYLEAVGFNFDTLSASAQRSLTGNGMNLNVMAAWLMYVMCHVVRKNDARPARFLVQEHDFAKKDVKDNDEDRNIVDDVQSEAESLVRIGV